MGFDVIIFVFILLCGACSFHIQDQSPDLPGYTTSIPTTEYYALQDLYNTTGGDQWSWGDIVIQGPIWFSEYYPDPCSFPSWQGLNCTCVTFSHPFKTPQCHIVEIRLTSFRLIGSLPSSLTNLIYLNELDFQNNYLNGTIPSFLGSLTNLTIIDFGNNFFTGPFPDFLGSMPQLYQLVLDTNRITGTLPSVLGSLKYLEEFNIADTLLHGPIPEELYQCTSLKYLQLAPSAMSGTLSNAVSNLFNLYELSLSDGQFTGTIPSSIGLLSDLHILYLNGNKFNGSIPDSLFWLQRVRILYLYDNYLTGTLSENVYNLTSVIDLSLLSNNIRGSIPISIGQLTNIRVLQVSDNQLSGSMPESIYNVTSLNTIFISKNSITGTISANISNLWNLTEISFNENKFTGFIPETICACDKLYDLDIFTNSLDGTIPDCIFHLKVLHGFRVMYNLLTGTISNNITSKFLSYLSLYINELSGPLPEYIDSLLTSFEVYQNQFSGSLTHTMFRNKTSLELMSFDNNYLSGSLPSSIGDLPILKYLYLSTNLLSGSLPKELSLIKFLVLGFFNENIFSGSIECFNATTQSYLTSIELSQNQLTGPFPVEVLSLKNLQTFAVVSNCLTGSIPEEVCQAIFLSALAIDGMHTASSCQQPVLSYFKSYTLKYSTPGTIPSCLFSLSSLETLHVSGNGLSGSLPYNLKLSPSLTDLILSHNIYSGDIPQTITEQQFIDLDLSYNKLTGVIDDVANISVPDSGYLYLQVNRLSGVIPGTLRNAETISILDGNLFACAYNRNSLPKNDKQYDYYECGTSSLQHALYVWVILATLLIGFSLVLFFSSGTMFRSIYKQINEYLEIFHEDNKLPNIRLFGRFLRSLRASMCFATLYIVIVLMTINIILSKYYGTYQYMYAWNVSSVFLSGFDPAIILLIFLLIWLCWFFGVFHTFMFVYGAGNRSRDEVDNNSKVDKTINYWHYFFLTIIAVFNFCIVLAVNIGYVYFTTQYNPSLVAVIQVLIAIFKLFWNDVVLRTMTHYASYYSLDDTQQLSAVQKRHIEGQNMTFYSYTMLFNIIITPCLATAAVSSDCFYNVLFPASKIVLSYNYLTCGNILNLKNETCALDVSVLTETSYQPPFLYRYQCSSTLVTTYAVLYVYMFILTAFVQPIATFLLYWFLQWYKKSRKESNPLNTSLTGSTKKKNHIFYKDRFNLRILTFLSVYVTFGVIFPPLAVIICIAVLLNTFFTQLMIGYSIKTDGGKSGSDCDNLKTYMLLEIFDEDCVDTADIFKHSLYDAGPVAALFYSFVIFDTYGDVGGSDAVGITVTLIILGCVLTTIAYVCMNVDVAGKFSKRQRCWETETNCVAECEMERTTSVLHIMKSQQT